MAAYPGGIDTQMQQGAMKTVFENYVSEKVHNKFPLKDLFKFTPVDFAGQEVQYDAHVKRNTSPMFVGEDSAFADAGAQGHIKVHISQRKAMARVRMTSESIADSSKTEGAWVSTKKDEMTRLIDDLARMDEYSLGSDGRGVLALVNGAANSATQTLDAPGGITGANFGNRFILPGMFIAFVNPATGAIRSSSVKKVLSCSSDGTQITLDSAFSSTDNDYIVQAANSSVTDVLDTSYERAFWGLMALIDDGTYRNNYFNVDRSSYGSFSSYVKSSTGAMSLDLFQQTADVVDQKLGGQITRMTGHHSVRRSYIRLTEADRRYQGASLLRPDGGTVAMKQGDLTMGEIPFQAIRSHPLATIFFLDEKGCGAVEYVSEKGKWVDEDGRILVRVGSGSSGRDAFEAWYRIRKQRHFRDPGKCARWDGITGQTLIVVRPAGD